MAMAVFSDQRGHGQTPHKKYATVSNQDVPPAEVPKTYLK